MPRADNIEALVWPFHAVAHLPCGENIAVRWNICIEDVHSSVPFWPHTLSLILLFMLVVFV